MAYCQSERGHFLFYLKIIEGVGKMCVLRWKSETEEETAIDNK